LLILIHLLLKVTLFCSFYQIRPFPQNLPYVRPCVSESSSYEIQQYKMSLKDLLVRLCVCSNYARIKECSMKLLQPNFSLIKLNLVIRNLTSMFSIGRNQLIKKRPVTRKTVK
jgi:hypothetical protein